MIDARAPPGAAAAIMSAIKQVFIGSLRFGQVRLPRRYH
jgi:hypothetical protein